jgi:hypothetical protein
MHLRSSLDKGLGLGSKIAAWGLAIGVLTLTATGCGGCGDSEVASCDAQGQNCQICDGYGCRSADPDVTGSGGSTSTTTGSGGAGGAAGQGGATNVGGAGGAAPCDPTTAACACAPDATCATSGTTCVAGLCVVGCDHSYECGSGKVCDNGACVVGCDATTPCAAGYACTKGTCQPDAQNPQCSAATPCATAGDVCVNGLCTTSCKTNGDCGAGSICDGVSGSCIPNPSPQPACSDTKACAEAQMCGADGYCHYPCTTENQCQLIDNRFTACDQSICKTQEELNPECGLDVACPAGKDCISNTCQ